MIDTAGRLDYLSQHFFANLGARLAMLSAEGHDIIRLDEGSPDQPPADHIISVLVKSASEPSHHGYQSHRGTRALREAWSEMYRRQFNVDVDPEREIIPLLGSKEGIFLIHLAFIEPEDIVLVPDPGYMTYARGTYVAGGTPVRMPLLSENDYLPDLSSIPENILRRAKILWINYPNNPTTATVSSDFFATVVDCARQYGLLVCHDAAYTQVIFEDDVAPSILSVPGAKEVAVEFNSLSKSHNMAGWRTGAIIGNARAVNAFYNLKTNTDSGHFLPILDASTAALRGDQTWLSRRNSLYQRRRDIVIKTLNSLGMMARIPKAGMYVWSPIPDGRKSVDFVASALEEAHISMTPGTVFGENGEGYFRIALTTNQERMRQAMERLVDWMGK